MKKGVISKKGVNYRPALMKVIGDEHPVKNNIHMQAHHIISEEGVNKSGTGNTLKTRGYDINEINNLVFLPSTPAGACHLGLQLHRGDHTYESEEEFLIDDKDDDHPKTYHNVIKKVLKSIESQIDDCDDEDFAKAQELLDEKSVDILKLVAEFKLPLTKIYKSFIQDSGNGCRNTIDVNEHEVSAQVCKCNRDHEGLENPMYKSSKLKPIITYGKKQYELKVGQ